MAKRDKLLQRMRNNPRDWAIGDVETLCEGFEITCKKPPRGSHYGVSDETQKEILTVPFDRPIKQVYIKKLVAFVDAVQAARKAKEDQKTDGRS
jgi:hypothetical protein